MKNRLNDLFDQMDDEEGNKLNDKIQIEDIDLDFENLIQIFKKKQLGEFYGNYLNREIKTQYSAKQITKFSSLLSDELLIKTPTFYISELLNFLLINSEDSTHNIFTNHLNKKIGNLGRNLKNNILHIHGGAGGACGKQVSNSSIFVYGNSSDYIGSEMKSGKICVEGNCVKAAGYSMYDGLIEINGDCGNEVAHGMRGGRIIVRGNVGEFLGKYMTGGAVDVYGEIKSLSRHINGGNIYHKEKQIIKNGEILDRSYLKK